MNVPSTPSCRCVDCAGAACLCGCNGAVTPATAPVAGAPCACGADCACDAGRQGCGCRAELS